MKPCVVYPDRFAHLDTNSSHFTVLNQVYTVLVGRTHNPKRRRRRTVPRLWRRPPRIGKRAFSKSRTGTWHELATIKKFGIDPVQTHSISTSSEGVALGI